jgi:multicomponent Na+:H+ antiporter subunit D
VLAQRFGVLRVSELARVRERAPWTSAAIAVAALSLLGLPPLCGFFGKWYVLRGALEAGQPLLAAAVVAGSLAGAVYVFRILERLFFSRGEEPGAEREGPAVLVAACAALAVGVIVLGLGNGYLASALLGLALPEGL